MFSQELKYLAACAAALSTPEAFLSPVGPPVLQEGAVLMEICLTVPALRCLLRVGMQIPQVDTWALFKTTRFNGMGLFSEF